MLLCKYVAVAFVWCVSGVLRVHVISVLGVLLCVVSSFVFLWFGV